MILCIAVSTIGLSPRIDSLLESLSAQTDRNFIVGFCDQSENGEFSKHLLTKALNFPFYISTTQKKGVSRGRNELIKNSPPEVTHFIFANDTSTFTAEFVSEVREQAADMQLTVLSYAENGNPRYILPRDSQELNRENVWLVLEAAVVISRDILVASNGFDETLGLGSDGPFQSGEGTDLLLRMLNLIERVSWAPQISVNGVTQNFNLSRRDQRRKAFRYGVGFGHLLSKYQYSKTRKLKALVGPIARSITFKTSRISLSEAIYSSTGRLIGMLHRSS
jgi:hypothetical protein